MTLCVRSVSTHEIKIYEDYFEGPVTPVRWKGLQKRAKRFATYYSSGGAWVVPCLRVTIFVDESLL